jgi:4-amino-4-deoxy-L-arabinose transferase-like glycosyltransferase
MASEHAITGSLPASLGARARAFARARALLVRHGPLATVLALSATLNVYALAQNGYANNFYSAGVRSMLGSFHDLLFNSFDPGGLISIDKPPLALWGQVASAKVLGFTPLALLLPEALAGTLAVAALYWATVRPFGRGAALVAALTLAVFPAFVAVSRDNGPDPLLILLMTLACVAALRAIERESKRALLVTAVLVALAFNTKTLAACLVVPPIALAYMLCAPGSAAHRARQLAGAGLVMVALSLSWLLLVDLTPASHRPYVGSSQHNSELGLAFAYNGLGRVGGEEGAQGEIPRRPGASVLTEPAQPGGGGSGPTVAPVLPTLAHGTTTGVGSSAGPTGPLRLLGSELGRQGGWMLPFAFASMLALLTIAIRGRFARGARSEGDDRRLAAVLLFGGWFFLELLVLSFAGGIVHPYYVSALAPGAAAMTGAGAMLFGELARRRDPLLALLLLGLGATVAGQVVLLRHDHYLAWLPAALIAAAVITGLLAGLRLARARSRTEPVGPWVRWAVLPMLALLFVAPTAYATTTWLAPVNGTFPAAGPRAPAGPGGVGLEGAEPPVFRSLVGYLATHQATGRFAVLTVDSSTAAPLILMGTRAAALGGYGGTDPALDGSQLSRLVARGEARYVLLGGGYSERGGNRATAAALRACREVPTAAWGGPPLEPYSFVLFDCRGREAALREGARGAPGS